MSPGPAPGPQTRRTGSGGGRDTHVKRRDPPPSFPYLLWGGSSVSEGAGHCEPGVSAHELGDSEDAKPTFGPVGNTETTHGTEAQVDSARVFDGEVLQVGR